MPEWTVCFTTLHSVGDQWKGYSALLSFVRSAKYGLQDLTKDIYSCMTIVENTTEAAATTMEVLHEQGRQILVVNTGIQASWQYQTENDMSFEVCRQRGGQAESSHRLGRRCSGGQTETI